MSSEKGHKFYMRKKPKLIKDFDSRLDIAKELIAKYIEESKIDVLYEQMRNKFETIIPELQFIGGGRNPFTMMLIEGAMTLAMCLELEKEGLKFRDIAEIFYNYFELVNKDKKENFEKVGKNTENLYFEESHIDFLRGFAKETQLKKFSAR